jgi:hypothetical protein
VPLLPGRVRDLRDDRFDLRVVAVEAVVEAHGIERVTEIAQVREQADRALGPRAGLPGDEIAHGCIEWLVRVAVEVGAPEPRRRRAARRPQQVSVEEMRQLRQVEIGHEERIREAVRRRLVPAMANGAGVEAAMHQTARRR